MAEVAGSGRLDGPLLRLATGRGPWKSRLAAEKKIVDIDKQAPETDEVWEEKHKLREELDEAQDVLSKHNYHTYLENTTRTGRYSRPTTSVAG
ncbi:hypothetical protein NDU88_004963 [Pleurodeles waltl]|uniref:Uncharacterized protein n=1 Tax=Pleurodeles waltl TaxID=8319 RepID=A0AAV7UGP3_PLEWA|nr:hypothetical protein NDU88_004963 [Pleurodeles waltl]